MLNDVFRLQADLFNAESNFRCPDSCNAPGCRMSDIIVEITLFDLIRIGRTLNTPVSHMFSQYCRLGLATCDENIRYKRLLIKMRKPCAFLFNNRCMIHDTKPVNCMLFPGYYQIKGLMRELSEKPIFHNFPCMKEPVAMSGKECTALKELGRMSSLEQALTHDYLFGEPRLIIDAKPLTKKLRRNYPKRRIFSLKDYDNLLEDAINSMNLSEHVMNKIIELDTVTGVKNLFEKMGDHVKMERLMLKLARPDVIFKLKRHHMKPYKRILRSPEVPFT